VNRILTKENEGAASGTLKVSGETIGTRYYAVLPNKFATRTNTSRKLPVFTAQFLHCTVSP
jgi:hypothetical protein